MSRFRVVRVQEDIGRVATKARCSEGEMMMSSKKRLSVLLVGVAMMSGCFEEEGDAPFFDGFLQSDSDDDNGDGDCDPYFGDCEEGPPMGMHDSGVLDGGPTDAGCEDSAAPPPPDCDPYSEECDPEPMEPTEPPIDPETEETGCDPYTGECVTPDEPEVPEEPEPVEPSELEECDPYIDDCTPPAN